MRRSEGKIRQVLKFRQCASMRKGQKKRKSLLNFRRVLKT